MKKLKEKYNKMNPREQKMFLIRVISGACFLLAGLIFGIVALAMFGWSFIIQLPFYVNFQYVLLLFGYVPLRERPF